MFSDQSLFLQWRWGKTLPTKKNISIRWHYVDKNARNCITNRTLPCKVKLIPEFILLYSIRLILAGLFDQIDDTNWKQECTPVGCVPTVTAVADIRCQCQGGENTPAWDQAARQGVISYTPAPVNRMTVRHFWKHYLPLRSVKMSKWCENRVNTLRGPHTVEYLTKEYIFLSLLFVIQKCVVLVNYICHYSVLRDYLLFVLFWNTTFETEEEKLFWNEKERTGRVLLAIDCLVAVWLRKITPGHQSFDEKHFASYIYSINAIAITGTLTVSQIIARFSLRAELRLMQFNFPCPVDFRRMIPTERDTLVIHVSWYKYAFISTWLHKKI